MKILYVAWEHRIRMAIRDAETNGRTIARIELTQDEFSDLLRELAPCDPTTRIRRRAGWLVYDGVHITRV